MRPNNQILLKSPHQNLLAGSAPGLHKLLLLVVFTTLIILCSGVTHYVQLTICNCTPLDRFICIHTVNTLLCFMNHSGWCI